MTGLVEGRKGEEKAHSEGVFCTRVYFPHLLVVLLEEGQLVVQALDLHLQVRLGQGGLV